MALYPPPTESLPVFNPEVFQNATNTLSIGDLKSQFLQFPISQTAQETINQLAITTLGTYKTQTYKQTTNLTELATIGYVNDAAGAPGNYAVLNASNTFTGATNTFNAVAATSIATTGTSSIAGYAPLNASNTFSGATNTFNAVAATSITTTGTSSIAGYAPLASPALTGTPTAPTPAGGDISTAIATTQFIYNSISPLQKVFTFTSDSSGNSNWTWTNPQGIPATANSFYWTITNKNPGSNVYTSSTTTVSIAANATNGFVASGYAYKNSYGTITPSVITGSALAPSAPVSYQGLQSAPTFKALQGSASGAVYQPVYQFTLPTGGNLTSNIYLLMTFTVIT
jgi:hypothetical protein